MSNISIKLEKTNGWILAFPREIYLCQPKVYYAKYEILQAFPV